jgi:hypothetical protein
MVSILLAKGLRFAHFLAIVLFLSAFEVLSNYPSAWRDVYYHGSAVKNILVTGYIENTWNNYPTHWPLSFVLWVAESYVTGLAPVVSNLLLLLPMSVFFCLVTYSLMKKLMPGKEDLVNASCILLFLLNVNHRNEFVFLHFNTRLFSFTLELAVILVFHELFVRQTGLLQQKGAIAGRAGAVILMLISFGITMSHILAPVLVMSLFLFFSVFRGGIGRRHAVIMMLLALVPYLLWNFSHASSFMESGLQSILDPYSRLIALEIMKGMYVISEPVPAFGEILRTYYKILLSVLTGASLVTVVLYYRRDGTTRFITIIFLASIVTSLFALLTFGLNGAVHRTIFNVSLPITALPMVLVWKNSKSRKVSIMLAVLLAVLVVPHYWLAHESSYARNMNFVTSTESVFAFTSSIRGEETLNVVGELAYGYNYYDPYYPNHNDVSIDPLKIGRSTELRSLGLALAQAKGVKLLGVKNVIHWAQFCQSYRESEIVWSTDVYHCLDDRCSRIYDSGYYTLYN